MAKNLISMKVSSGGYGSHYTVPSGKIAKVTIAGYPITNDATAQLIIGSSISGTLGICSASSGMQVAKLTANLTAQYNPETTINYATVAGIVGKLIPRTHHLVEGESIASTYHFELNLMIVEEDLGIQ